MHFNHLCERKGTRRPACGIPEIWPVDLHLSLEIGHEIEKPVIVGRNAGRQTVFPKS